MEPGLVKDSGTIVIMCRDIYQFGEHWVFHFSIRSCRRSLLRPHFTIDCVYFIDITSFKIIFFCIIIVIIIVISNCNMLWEIDLSHGIFGVCGMWYLDDFFIGCSVEGFSVIGIWIGCLGIIIYSNMVLTSICVTSTKIIML